MDVLGIGVSAASGATVGVGLFRYLGDQWLTSKFSERLERFKHEQQRGIEELRLRINTTFDRAVKLHGYEYDVLPTLWEKLSEAFGYVNSLVSPMQSYPDLDKLTPAAFDHFLNESGLPDYQKQELTMSDQRTRDYMALRFWQAFSSVNEKFNDFSRYFSGKSIFIAPELKEQVQRLRTMMIAALVEKEEEERDPNPRAGRWENCTALRKEGEDLLNSIGEAIRRKLSSSAGASLSLDDDPAEGP